ncbi:hypothetical protein [Arthrobacter sp. NPDC093139]|uniref:hypothetical protein n=1 Tax=Arthrobacter sp. NPDC093139 TaxID=3363945 RepID=UPI00380D8B9D
MAASRWHAAFAFFCRTGLLVGILAVLAGILGMHVITGSHGMHSPAALTAAHAATDHAGSTAVGAHAAHGTPGTSSGHHSSGGHNADGVSAEECACSGNCAGMHSMTVSCTPSGKTGSLTVPVPGTAVFGAVSNAGVHAALPGSYPYLPGSPSPGELSISRT